jgi:uncharacterized protein with NRDE domain
MCLIVFAVAAHPDLPLVVLANRDEAYVRPALSAHAWTDFPLVFAGRDREKGGTWLGVTRTGRFAAVTNVRDPLARRYGESRGALVRDALVSPMPTGEWAVAINRPQYPAFNLLVGSARELFYAQDASTQPLRVGAGVHGLSNARIDVPWPKVQRATERLQKLLATSEFDLEAAFAILTDRTQAPDAELPGTGVSLELERALSSAFITMPGYGTRACTVVLFHRDGTLRFVERTYGEGGAPGTATDVLLQVA